MRFLVFKNAEYADGQFRLLDSFEAVKFVFNGGKAILNVTLKDYTKPEKPETQPAEPCIFHFMPSLCAGAPLRPEILFRLTVGSFDRWTVESLDRLESTPKSFFPPRLHASA